MKKISIIALMLSATALTFSCGKKDPEVAPALEIPTQFSNKSVEENKAHLENDGIKMINDMKTLKNTAAINAAASLAKLFNTSGQKVNKTPGLNIIESLAKFKRGGSEQEVFAAMKLADLSQNSLQAEFNNLKGTNVWNATAEEFTFTAGGNAIIYKFPSKDGGTTNDATLSIRDFQSMTPTSNAIDNDYSDLPTNLVMDLTVGSNKTLDFSFKAGYNSAGEPTSTSISLGLAPFSFNISGSNDTKTAKFDYTLKNGSNPIVSFGGKSNGNFSNIGENDDAEEAVDYAEAYFQVMNTRIAGTVDAKALQSEIKALGDNATGAQMAAVCNKHYKLVVFYADSKQKIADTEFYGETKTDSYTYYNYETNTYETITETYETVNVRLKFKDGSPANLDTYFGSGFDKISTEWNNFMEELENDLG